MGLFKISRLITNPNPGTSSFPFGTVGVVDVSVLLSCCDGKGDGLVGAVFVSTEVLDAGDAAVDGCSAVWLSVVVAVGIESGAGEGGATETIGWGAAFNGFTGLIGLTGLVTFVGFVIAFTHVFCVSTHAPKIG